MSEKKKVLLAGESWMSFTTHVKGFDTFYTSVYETGEKFLKAALEEGGYDFTFLPNHLAMEEFPFKMEELKQYDLLVLSDIGANTLLLPGATFTRSEMMPNRCNLIRDYVLEGGALLMVGGYMTFSGIDGKGKWQDTAVQEVLPVTLLQVAGRPDTQVARIFVLRGEMPFLYTGTLPYPGVGCVKILFEKRIVSHSLWAIDSD